MNGNPDLDRERLTSLFDDLSRELEFARTRVQIYVIGGAAMSMAFSRDRTTRDVDARIDAGHGALMKAVEKSRASGASLETGSTKKRRARYPGNRTETRGRFTTRRTSR